MLDADVYAALAVVDAGRARRRAARGCWRRPCATSGAPASTATTRPGTGCGRSASGSTDLEQAFSRGIRDGRRSTQVPGLGPGRPARRLGRRPPRGRRRGHGHHGVPRHLPVPDLLRRRRGAAGGGAPRSSTSAGPTTSRCWRSCSSCGTSRPRCSATRTGRRFDAEVKMIGTGPAIGEFVDRISARRRGRPASATSRCCSSGPARRTRTSRRSTCPTGATTPRWCAASASSVDAQQVRRYFDFGKVRQGLLDVTGRLFGLRLRARCTTRRPGTPTWRRTT